MLGWFRALMPKEEQFFELFTRHARVTLAGAQALRALLKGEAVPLLSSLGRHAARLNSLTEEMIRLEEQADQLHDQGRKQLFLNKKDAIAFVIGTEVYEHLETVVDRFEDVANEISAIVIENV